MTIMRERPTQTRKWPTPEEADRIALELEAQRVQVPAVMAQLEALVQQRRVGNVPST
jgi:hypothetical protein